MSFILSYKNLFKFLSVKYDELHTFYLKIVIFIIKHFYKKLISHFEWDISKLEKKVTQLE